MNVSAFQSSNRHEGPHLSQSLSLSLTSVEEESGRLPRLEVERDLVVGGEDRVDAVAVQVVREVLAAPERRLGRQHRCNEEEEKIEETVYDLCVSGEITSVLLWHQ